MRININKKNLLDIINIKFKVFDPIDSFMSKEDLISVVESFNLSNNVFFPLPIYLDIEIKKGKEFTFNLPSTHNSLIYLIEGEVKVGEQNHNPIKDSTLIILTRGEKLKVSGLTKAKFLLISGKPIGEPIARGGPFVMNTKEEILKAVQDYHNGTFVR